MADKYLHGSNKKAGGRKQTTQFMMERQCGPGGNPNLYLTWAITSIQTSLALLPLGLCGVFLVPFSREFKARWRRAARASRMPLRPLGQSEGTRGREAAV